MEVFETAAELRAACETRLGKTVLVPTMGALHEGHLSLVRLAKTVAPNVVVSIFVNPTQFNNAVDLAKYPRDLSRDLTLLEPYGITGVFAPEPQEIYPPGFRTFVEVGGLSEPLEGACRPGHFRGVATVVTLLFNLVRPDLAIFSEKDFQQLRVLEQMTADLRLPVTVLRAPFLRDPDGLAMSSRNVRLSPEARASALKLSRGLFAAKALYDSGERLSRRLRERVLAELAGDSLIAPEYVEVAEERDLSPVEAASSSSRILLAATVGSVRLIDNIGLG